MTRYYFNVKDGRVSLDDEGTEFPSIDAAHDEAVRLSGAILRDGASASLWSGSPWQLWVTDKPNGEGQTLFTLQFSAIQGAAKPD
jgi:hypothetical protein